MVLRDSLHILWNHTGVCTERTNVMQEKGGASGQSGSAQSSTTGFSVLMTQNTRHVYMGNYFTDFATCTNSPEERHIELLQNVGIFNPFLRREIIHTRQRRSRDYVSTSIIWHKQLAFWHDSFLESNRSNYEHSVSLHKKWHLVVTVPWRRHLIS